MAELVFKSAGVSSREIDLSFPTQTAPVGIPAGVIGTSNEGPAFVPVTVSNFSEFQNIFGASDGEKFGPIAVSQWLKNAQSCTFIRVLGVGDGKQKASSGVVNRAGFFVGDELVQNSGIIGGNPYAYSAAGQPQIKGRSYFLGCFMSESAGSTVFSSAGIQTNSTGSAILRGVLLAPSGVILHLSGGDGRSGQPSSSQTAIASSGDLIGRKGSLTGSVNLSNGNFVMLLNGHKNTAAYPNVITASFTSTSPNYFANKFNTDPYKIEEAGHLLYSYYDVAPNYAAITGSGVIKSSYVSPVGSGYEDIGFLLTSSLDRSASTPSSVVPLYEDFRDRFKTAVSPYVISQSPNQNLFRIHALSAGAATNTKFKISIENITRINASSYPTFDLIVRDFYDSDEKKVVLESFRGINLNPDSDRYIGRAIGDMNTYFEFDKDALSQKINVTGNHPVKSNYIRVEITDNVNNGVIDKTSIPCGFRGPLQVVSSGSILANPYSADVYNATDPHRAVINPPIPYRQTVALGTGDTKRVANNLYWGMQFNNASSVTEPNLPSVFNESFDSYVKFFPTHRTDGRNFAEASDTICNNLFSLENIQVRTGSAGTNGANLDADVDYWLSASYVRDGNITTNDTNKTRAFRPSDLEVPGNRRYAKFSFFLQGGFDGTNVLNSDKDKLTNNAVRREIDNSSDQGGVNGATTAAYRKAIDIMGVKSEVDIKLLATPGMRVPAITDYAITAVENRFDALYLMDVEKYNNDNVIMTGSSDLVNVKNTVQAFKSRGLDSSFAAAYFPDVVIRDPNLDQLVNVPATVAVLGAFSLNDAIAHPWFAPAGFTRGALDAVETVDVRLSRKNLDDLYDVDINPLTSFPGTGIVVYGQKTLLASASALDRINVRRLLISVRRSVRKVANSLLFEPNRQETLDKFNALVNPIMQRVQEQGGVDRYKVIIDTTTTTQADVENNTIRGKIYLQPTRTVEFIALDFVVTNAGANI